MISSVKFYHIEKGIKFDRSKRQGNQQEGDIGPGTYDPKMVLLSKEGGVINKSKRDRSQEVNEIGPGAYNSGKSEFGGKRGYTIQGKPRTHSQEDGPGPYSYDYRRLMDKRDWGHGVKIPKGQRRERQPMTEAGPGSYDIKDQHDGGFKFGKSKKGYENDPSIPGPGAYSLKELPFLSNAGKFAKQKRDYERHSATGETGPGAYNIKSDHKGGFKFGKDKKEHRLAEEVPGPGKYEPKRVNPLSNLGTFGRNKRPTDRRENYTSDDRNYDPKIDNWCGGYSIGRGKRQPLASNHETPGVGAYNYKGASIDPRTGYSFKRSHKEEKPQTTPGFYKPFYSVPDVPKYLLPPEPQRKIHL